MARDIAAAVASGATAATAGRNDWPTVVAADLLAHRGACAVIPGEHQSPAVHAIAHAMNVALGNTGKTVFYTAPLEFQPVDQVESLRELVSAMDAGSVELLLMLGGNPVYNAPSDFEFAQRLRKVKSAIHVGLHHDETSALCDWHVPESHFFEEWSDVRSSDGTLTILQPMIDPLYGSHSQLSVLDGILQYPPRGSYEIVRAYWSDQHRVVISSHGGESRCAREWSRIPRYLPSSRPSRRPGRCLRDRSDPRIWNWCFGPTLTSTTARTRIIAGSRNFPARFPS